MKRWQIIAAAPISLLMLLYLGESASAQDAQPLASVVASIVAKTGIIIDGILNVWVVGNTLTDPQGQLLISALAQTIVNTTHQLAQIVTLF